MDWQKQEAEKWDRVKESLGEATRGINCIDYYTPEPKIEVQFCPVCECHVQAERTYDNYEKRWLWMCLKCYSYIDL